MGEGLRVLILAAGKGTRMLSGQVKVLHKLCGLPILEYLLRAVAPLKAEETIVVIGHQGKLVRERFAGRGLVFIEQREQLGTGHALLQAGPSLEDKGGEILILPSDLPLLKTELLEEFVLFHRGHKGKLSLLTTDRDDPRGYGRIVRDGTGDVQRIVEEEDAKPQERGIREVNSGIYLVSNDRLLWEALEKLDDANAQGEYYLTDIVAPYREGGEAVRALVAEEGEELAGVNSRADLARAEAILRGRKLAQAMERGATVVAPETVIIEWEVELEQDAVIGPGSSVKGRGRIGRGALIEATQVEGFEIGEGSRIMMSLLRAEEQKKEGK
ncbi:MAG: NTP transferase domain-containing protein [Candidatus Bipolaricaulia bacterium]